MGRSAVLFLVIIYTSVGIVCSADTWDGIDREAAHGSVVDEDLNNQQLHVVSTFMKDVPQHEKEDELDVKVDNATTDTLGGNTNQTTPKKHSTLATVFDEAVDNEFKDDTVEMDAESRRNYNMTLERKEAKEETVIRISKGASVNNPTDKNETSSPVQNKNKVTGEQNVEELIDQENNEYVLANPNTGNLELQLDPLFLKDLTLMFVLSSFLGMMLESLNFSPIAGYVLSGSILGPGGFNLLRRLVQIETVSQVGIYMLLFVLGLEFNIQKLNGLRYVTLLGGIVQMLLMALAIGLIAQLAGGGVREGLLVGATLAMSSTSIVLKSLDSYDEHVLFKKISTGTLLLQDCLVGVLFACVPMFSSDELEESLTVIFFKFFGSLVGFILLCALLSWFVMPYVMGWISRVCSVEIHRLFAVAFCFSIASLGGVSGVSAELGAFAAGVVIGRANYGDSTHHKIDQLEAVFMALFLSSIGIIMSPSFLAEHALFLGGTFFVSLTLKLVIFTLVIKLFGYPIMTCLAVGFSLTPISEFAFVIFSTSYKLSIIKRHWYMLLLGVTGLSMFISPFIVQVIKPLVRQHMSNGPADARHGEVHNGVAIEITERGGSYSEVKGVEMHAHSLHRRTSSSGHVE